ncbi:CdiA family toxin C-terminal domain-containing protein [Marinobacter lacisalsi]|uniref:CdiA family toxin C-terminal domain-containing protein n=1 Tax=Marinobacter lacisalsi TaxID=475979 RepID=A0ABV8QDZ3_9GAMM
MFHRDPILIKAPLGRIYAFTRYYRGNNIFDGPHLAFPHDRGYAREHLLALTRHIGDDPFNDRLHDVWQMVFQKPWTRPGSLQELVMDLTDKITRGELFVYEELDPDRAYQIPVHDGPSEGGPVSVDRGDLQGEKPSMDRPRVSGPPVARSTSWGSDYADGLSDTASAMASDIASEQTELYENTSGWGNVMYPVFKPLENAGRFVGNTVGLLSALSPNGMKPEVAQYWQDMGEGFQALGGRVVDAVGGDGRAAGEITPAVASILVSKKVPGSTSFTRFVGNYDEHIIYRDFDVPRRRGIGGAHNGDEFLKYSNEFKVEEIIPHPTVDGIETVRYRMAALDKAGDPTGEYRAAILEKTVYDPSKVSNEQFLDWGRQAAAEAQSAGRLNREWVGTASNSLEFRGYLDETGAVKSFFPNF